MKFGGIFSSKFILIAIFGVSFICCKKSGKSKNEKVEKHLTKTPADVNILYDNATMRYSVSQNVKSKKVSCANDNINEMVRSVRCKPRLTVVELVSGNKNKFIPNAVLAKRCSGSCDGFQRCITAKSANTTFFVKEVVRDKTYCSAIEILEDKECACECLLKPKDCTAYQRYSYNTCSCKCNDDAEFRKCKNSVNKNVEWNERKCACECVASQSCSNGLDWDTNKCRCVKQVG